MEVLLYTEKDLLPPESRYLYSDRQNHPPSSFTEASLIRDTIPIVRIVDNFLASARGLPATAVIGTRLCARVE
jgi:hypothetical protein